MSDTADVLRGQLQALTAVSFALVHGLVAGGVLEAAEMRDIVNTADECLPEDVHPIATEILALMISALPRTSRASETPPAEEAPCNPRNAIELERGRVGGARHTASLRLAQAERHAAGGAERVAAQERLLTRLRDNGYGIDLAEETLRVLKETQRLLEANRNQLRAMAEQASG